MTKISIEVTVLEIESESAKISGTGVLLSLSKKYLLKDMKAGDKFFLTLASEEADKKNKTVLAKEILNQILRK